MLLPAMLEEKYDTTPDYFIKRFFFAYIALIVMILVVRKFLFQV